VQVVRGQVIILAIVGTRTLACPGDPQRTGQAACYAIVTLAPDVVITGAARGTDALAAAAARWCGYTESRGTLRIFHPASYRWPDLKARDALLAAQCTHLLRISCKAATTYGSGWTADEAARLGADVDRLQVCP
jgi:hypothetical protein